jgi:cobalt/nickel transport protein
MTTPALQQQPSQSSPAVYVIGILLIIILTAVPFVLIKDSEFGGADGAGADAIASVAPDYDPGWISPIWEPPGGETESLLFALQATAGGVAIGYFFGYKRAQRKAADNTSS